MLFSVHGPQFTRVVAESGVADERESLIAAFGVIGVNDMQIDLIVFHMFEVEDFVL
jgi:hypothetical protein